MRTARFAIWAAASRWPCTTWPRATPAGRRPGGPAAAVLCPGRRQRPVRRQPRDRPARAAGRGRRHRFPGHLSLCLFPRGAQPRHHLPRHPQGAAGLRGACAQGQTGLGALLASALRPVPASPRRSVAGRGARRGEALRCHTVGGVFFIRRSRQLDGRRCAERTDARGRQTHSPSASPRTVTTRSNTRARPPATSGFRCTTTTSPAPTWPVRSAKWRGPTTNPSATARPRRH